MAMSVDDAGRAVLSQAVSAYRQALGTRLVAAYALGSLAHGGFDPLVSDVDLALILADPPQPSDVETIGRVAETIKADGTPLHERLSVFWGTASTLRGAQPGGRFPPLDRLDLVQNGLLLTGEDGREGIPRPKRVELLVAGAEFALDYLAGIRPASGPADNGAGSMRPADQLALEQIRRPAVLLDRGVRHVTKVVLFPVRFLYTAETGLVGTNQSAAEHHLSVVGAPSANLVAAAITWRLNEPDRAEAMALLQEELIPLYLHYIGDHVTRLINVDRRDLASAFLEWRNRIVA